MILCSWWYVTNAKGNPPLHGAALIWSEFMQNIPIPIIVCIILLCATLDLLSPLINSPWIWSLVRVMSRGYVAADHKYVHIQNDRSHYISIVNLQFLPNSATAEAVTVRMYLRLNASPLCRSTCSSSIVWYTGKGRHIHVASNINVIVN